MANDYLVGNGLSEKDLEIATWWVRHEIALRRLGYGSLIGLSILCWGYVAWTVLDSYALSRVRENRVFGHLINNQLNATSVDGNLPQTLQPSDVSVFDGTDGRRDFLVELVNPNPNWWAQFSYHFDVGGVQTPSRQGYVLPQEQHYLTELGWKNAGGGHSAQLIVDHLQWQRLNPTSVDRDYAGFLARHWQVTATDISYRNDLTIGDKKIGQTSFNLRNPSAFGFWSIDLTVVLSQQGRPVAVTVINQQQLKPGEIRPVTVNWFDAVGDVNKTDIRPSANILDPNVYLSSQQF